MSQKFRMVTSEDAPQSAIEENGTFSDLPPLVVSLYALAAGLRTQPRPLEGDRMRFNRVIAFLRYSAQTQGMLAPPVVVSDLKLNPGWGW